MATTTRTEIFACDGCGRFRQREPLTISAYLGNGETIDFCDGMCFVECMARNGTLAHQRGQLLLIFGMSPSQHFEEAMTAIRNSNMDA